MSKELIVSANRHETRVAVLEDDQVVEVYYQREKEYSLAGSIHKGRVTRVLPGMQSAFAVSYTHLRQRTPHVQCANRRRFLCISVPVLQSWRGLRISTKISLHGPRFGVCWWRQLN